MVDERGDGLEGFSSVVAGWFRVTFVSPTPIQRRAWPAIAKGDDVLVVAPTGQGKTLAAFLWAMDELMAAAPGDRSAKAQGAKGGVSILYISPLKALAADVERNLRAPLRAIVDRGRETGSEPAGLTVAMRTGDTPAKERQRLLRCPPDILITTPESLYLMLTSKAAEVLSSVGTVIVDEVHSVAGTKRGAHLSLSLERLDALLDHPAQRIGLSATVRPPERVARFLGGEREVTMVVDGSRPAMELSVRVPVADLTAVPEYLGGARRDGGAAGAPTSGRPGDAWKTDRTMRAAMAAESRDGRAERAPVPRARPGVRRESRLGSRSIWPHLEAAILDEVEAHRSTIVFVNSRGLCERLCARLNELHWERLGLLGDEQGPEGSFRSDMGSAALHGRGAPDGAPIIARAHHGSVSKDRRARIEADLKAGALSCVVATSSLELGIDMGSVDLVIQVAAPLSVASGLQRVGRADHRVDGCSRAILYPRTRSEVVDCAVAVEAMGAGDIEETVLVRAPLDVLAQQTVAQVVHGDITADEWFSLVRRSANYAGLSREPFDAVLAQVSGAWAAAGPAALAPRITWDRETGVLSALPAGRRLAISSAGTIPDRGMYPVYVEGARDSRSKGRRRVGELDEEMVHESRVGDVITLGTTTWRISRIADDRVLVEPSDARASRLPFWHGEGAGRPLADGERKGRFLGEMTRALDPSGTLGAEAEERLSEDGLDGFARANLANLLVRQRAATGHVPSDRDIVLEYVEAEPGDLRLVIHSPLGRRVHMPWALAISAVIERDWGYDPQAMAADDGIVLRIQDPGATGALPGAATVTFEAEELVSIVRAQVTATSLFSARFRECAARALLMAPRSFGSRTPLWLQRIQSSQLLEVARTLGGFPVVDEALREVMEDVYDMAGLQEVMGRIRGGAIRLHEVHPQTPSPLAAPLLFGYVGEHLYDEDRPVGERRLAALSVDPTLLGEMLGDGSMEALLDPALVAEVEARLQHTDGECRLEGAQGIMRLLRELGPLGEDELAERLRDGTDIGDLVASLEAEHRVVRVVIAGREVLADAAEAPLLSAVLGCAIPTWARAEGPGIAEAAHPLDVLVARHGRTHGPFSCGGLAEHLGLGAALVEESLGRVAATGALLSCAMGEDDRGRPLTWVGSDVLRRIRGRALARARSQVEAVPLEVFQEHVLRLQAIPAPGDETDPLDATAQALALLEGVALPVTLWERVILPDRVAGYRPALLDELLAEGDVVWSGSTRPRAGEKGAPTHLVTFHPTDSPFAPQPAQGPGEPVEDLPMGVAADGEGAGELMALLAKVGTTTPAGLVELAVDQWGENPGQDRVLKALEALLWRGLVLCDRFDVARSQGRSGTGRTTARRRSRSRYAARASAMVAPKAPLRGAGATAGLWSVALGAEVPDTERAVAQVESLLARYGVVTPALVAQEGVPAMWSWVYPVLKAMEGSGALLRGSFVEGLEPLQYASSDTVEALRRLREEGDPRELRVLSAVDPALLAGSVVPWPEAPAPDGAAPAERPSRRQDALVVMRGGTPLLHGSAHLAHLTLLDEVDEGTFERAVGMLLERALADAVRQGRSRARERIEVETVDGDPVLQGPWAQVLQGLGFKRTTGGLRFYADPL